MHQLIVIGKKNVSTNLLANNYGWYNILHFRFLFLFFLEEIFDDRIQNMVETPLDLKGHWPQVLDCFIIVSFHACIWIIEVALRTPSYLGTH